MKRKIWGLVFLIGLLGVYSCQNELETHHNIQQNQLKEHIDFIASLGFDVSDISDQGEYYLVEGDMMLLKDSLFAYGSFTKQYYAGRGHTVSEDNVKDITIWIDPAVPSTSMRDWKTAVINAAEVWSSVPFCAVNMRIVETENADIKVSMYHGESGEIAKAYLPLYPRAGSALFINNNAGLWPDDVKVWHMVHELGHCLGLLHTNYQFWGIDDGDHFLIPGTPEYDGNSVMNKHFGGWTSLTEYDIAAIQWLYPGPPPPPDPDCSHHNCECYATANLIIRNRTSENFPVTFNFTPISRVDGVPTLNVDPTQIFIERIAANDQITERTLDRLVVRPGYLISGSYRAAGQMYSIPLRQLVNFMPSTSPPYRTNFNIYIDIAEDGYPTFSLSD